MSKILSSPILIGGIALAVIVALILGLAGVVGMFTGPSDKDVAQAAANAAAGKADALAVNTAVNAMDTRLAAVEATLATLPTSADVQALSGQIAGLRTDLASLPDYGPQLTAFEQRLTTVEARITALEAAAATPDPAATQSPTETRIELGSCPGYEGRAYARAENLTDSVDINKAWIVQCFVLEPPSMSTVAEATEWYESITALDFKVIGGKPRSAFLGDGNGQPAWIMGNWDFTNAGRGVAIADVRVEVPEAVRDYVTLGEYLVGFHPVGPGTEGMYIYIAYTVSSDDQVMNADLVQAWAIIPTP